MFMLAPDTHKEEKVDMTDLMAAYLSIPAEDRDACVKYAVATRMPDQMPPKTDKPAAKAFASLVQKAPTETVVGFLKTLGKESHPAEATELCPHCDREVTLLWDTKADGYKAFCPHCGGRLMLCDACMHECTGGCDYDSAPDSCKHNPSPAQKVGDTITVSARKLSEYSKRLRFCYIVGEADDPRLPCMLNVNGKRAMSETDEVEVMDMSHGVFTLKAKSTDVTFRLTKEELVAATKPDAPGRKYVMVLPLDAFVRHCGCFQNAEEKIPGLLCAPNNGYNCTHEDQEETETAEVEDGEDVEIGCCHAYSCPLGYCPDNSDLVDWGVLDEGDVPEDEMSYSNHDYICVTNVETLARLDAKGIKTYATKHAEEE